MGMNRHEMMLMLEQAIGSMDLGYLESMDMVWADEAHYLECRVAGRTFRIRVEQVEPTEPQP